MIFLQLVLLPVFPGGGAQEVISLPASNTWLPVVWGYVPRGHYRYQTVNRWCLEVTSSISSSLLSVPGTPDGHLYYHTIYYIILYFITLYYIDASTDHVCYHIIYYVILYVVILAFMGRNKFATAPMNE